MSLKEVKKEPTKLINSQERRTMSNSGRQNGAQDGKVEIKLEARSYETESLKSNPVAYLSNLLWLSNSDIYFAFSKGLPKL